MSESAYLRRSLSQPTGCSRQEGEAIIGGLSLTESVSFGRFAGEALAQDRWSTIPHNRYLEEAERHSKPGSVAEKRAFFEAHFKRKAAERAAAAAAAAAALLEAAEQSAREDKNRCDHGHNEDSSAASENPPTPPKVPSSPPKAPPTAAAKGSKSIHMSINFSSGNKSESKKSLLLASLEAKPKARKSSVPTTTKELVIACQLPVHGRNSKSSNGMIATKPRSSIVVAASPFNLRSEERAARRKEFNERLEQRKNVEEAAKKHPPPKLGGRKQSSNKTADATTTTTSRPRRSSTKAMCTGNDRTAASHPLTSSRSRKKNARENSSPNIQKKIETLV